MAEFKYIIESSIDVPESITVKGKVIKAEIDDTFEGEIEYWDEKYSDEQNADVGAEIDYYWRIKIRPDRNGKFTAVLKLNGEEIISDTFYPDNVTINEILDRFVGTLEGLI